VVVLDIVSEKEVAYQELPTPEVKMLPASETILSVIKHVEAVYHVRMLIVLMVINTAKSMY
jgi:hypothetical protein